MILIQPIIKLVLELRAIKSASDIELKQYKQHFIKQINQIELTVAKYAVVAFVDEMIMTSELVHKYQWAASSLQMHYFNEHCAGEKFFINLQKLQENSVANIDVLEVYLVCLEFDFAGKYRFSDPEKLDLIRNNIRQIVKSIRGKSNAINFINIRRDNPKEKAFFMSWLYKNKLSMSLVMILFCYFFVGILNYVNVSTELKKITQKTILLL